jgi:hypothetical protein
MGCHHEDEAGCSSETWEHLVTMQCTNPKAICHLNAAKNCKLYVANIFYDMPLSRSMPQLSLYFMLPTQLPCDKLFYFFVTMELYSA